MSLQGGSGYEIAFHAQAGELKPGMMEVGQSVTDSVNKLWIISASAGGAHFQPST